MKIVITGGHFSPAYSIIKKLNKKDEILVLGRRYAFEGDKNETFEYKICKENNIPFKNIKAGRLQRAITRHTLPSLLRFPKGIYQARKYLKEFNPDVVVTFGGYIALPVAIAAYILKIPVILHEQTLGVGLSNALISKFASVVLISFESSRRNLKNKNVILTGNPIRDEIFDGQKPEEVESSKPIIYITGGSTGSHAINSLIKEVLPELLSEYIVVHQTGNSKQFCDFDSLLKFKHSLNPDLQKNYLVKEFFTPQEVGWLFQNASLVVSRSGINTVSELLAFGAVSLLIPLSYGKINEQPENAEFFKKSGLGEYLEQDSITPQKLLVTINDMIRQRKKYIANKKKAQKLIDLNAADKIIDQICIYGEGRKARQTVTSF